MSPDVALLVRQFAEREVKSPPAWAGDALGPDAVSRMWVLVGASLGVAARDIPRELQDATHTLYRAEVTRLRES